MTGNLGIDQKQGWRPRYAAFIRRLALGVVPMAFLLSQSPVSAEVVVPEKARVMTGVELYMMFRDKTWKWENGAGRMQGEGRVFRAWAQSEAGATWAEGRWSVTDGGQLCLKGVWHSQSAAARDKTCFTHRILDGTIYQKREPAGDWYVFRHARPAADDAFNRLIVEDLVEAKLPIIRAVLNAHAEAKTNSVRPQTEANEVGGVQ
ncbi:MULTISPECIES: DUF995 domain-containing protein [unclassified Sinorhizobium]|uniref:DUF995 domain-containing protein n=1 Tax=unclassified Sinorhizobium TaxID=2613772 RepID=UPI0030148E27